MGSDPKSWAEAFVAELSVGGERVPFERVLARHLEAVTQLRGTSGLTWRSLASLLARAGARRADGGLISADQLRVGYARLTQQAAKVAQPPRVGRQPQSHDVRVIPLLPEARVERDSSEPAPALNPTKRDTPAQIRKPTDNDEVSDDDIAVALSRLTKLPPKP